MSLGAKANNLEFLRKKYPNNVPPFITIQYSRVVESYESVIEKINDAIKPALNGETPEEYAKRIDEIEKAIDVSNKKLAPYLDKIKGSGWHKVSVRTSALSEDLENNSFAGQYISFVDIDIRSVDLKRYVRKSFLSLFSPRVIEYAKARGITRLDIGGSVIVQEMFYGAKSGVMFTENGKGEITFAYVNIWQNAVVDGSNASTLSIPKTNLSAHKKSHQFSRIAEAGLELERYFKHPLDIEWSFSRQKYMLLQVRPTTLSTTNYSYSWDATNIAENYPGVTAPLTYSFIRGLYTRVYPEFFRLLGKRERTLKKHEEMFSNMLGYINGRVYYRIDNWYQLVSLIPGRKNHKFFEAMLNPARKRSAAFPTKKRNVFFSVSFIYLAIRLAWLLMVSGLHSRSFSKRINANLKKYERINLPSISADTIHEHLKEVRKDFIKMWRIPILNDVKVMIFHGIFKTVLLKNTDTETYLNSLRGLTQRVSIKPLEDLAALGREIDRVMKREKISKLDNLELSSSWEEIKETVQLYIDKYGGRAPDELQLENPRLGEDLWNVIYLAYLSRNHRTKKPAAHMSRTNDRQNILHKLFAAFVIRNLRQAIDNRERFRFNRAQVFGLARSAYLSIGQKFAEAKVIRQTDDIFWLTEDEIESAIEGHSWSYDLNDIVELRKKKFQKYRQMQFWRRITGEGVIAPAFVVDSTPHDLLSSGKTGLGVSSGRATGKVVVVEKFDPKLNIEGKILVVRHIDPGWTLLLVQAKGVITEQGNALSHVSIVSRELGIPAVVGLEGALERFRNGDIVTVDGTSGEILSES